MKNSVYKSSNKKHQFLFDMFERVEFLRKNILIIKSKLESMTIILVILHQHSKYI